MNKIVELVNAKKYHDALNELNKLIVSYPEKYDVFMTMGNIHKLLKNYTEALKLYKCAYNIAPLSEPLLNAMHEVYFVLLDQSTDLKELKKLLKEMLLHYPDDGMIHYYFLEQFMKNSINQIRQ